jgi:hypothetical protein
MSPAARISLAIAVAWAGGFGSVAGPGWSRLAAALAVLLGCTWLRSHAREAGTQARLHGAVRVFALALLLGLLARALGRVVIEVPAAAWALPIMGVVIGVVVGVLVGVGSQLVREPRTGNVAVALAVPLALLLALVAALAGTWFEARATQPRGLAHSGPVIGVHPRQATAVRIDGFGPHDLVVDDYVDPPGGLGYDPERWAAWLELELHAIAQTHYADGPARAREAYANAEVRVVDASVPPAELAAYASLLGVEVRSGTTGEGSKVEFVCPGQTLGPNRAAAPEPSRACPRKYVVDGSTGLGTSSRFPGYTEVRGRDRVRLATWIGWPHADARRDRRSLALESGAWLLVLVLGSFAFARKSGPPRDFFGSSAMAGMAALVLAGIAAIGSTPTLDASTGGPTWLAMAVIVLAPASPNDPPERGGKNFGWAIAGLLALLSASPLAGLGDVVALLDASVEPLVLELGLDWATSRALAGSLAVVALAAGLGACARSLFESRARPATLGRREAIYLFAVALTVAVALALRKPTDDLALLDGAAALLLASTLHLEHRAWPARLAFAVALVLACCLGPAMAMARDGAVGPVALGSAILAALGCLALVLCAGGQPDRLA